MLGQKRFCYTTYNNLVFITSSPNYAGKQPVLHNLPHTMQGDTYPTEWYMSN